MKTKGRLLIRKQDFSFSHVDSHVSARRMHFSPMLSVLLFQLYRCIAGVYIGRTAAFAWIREARPGPSGFSKGPVTSRLLGRSKYLNLTPRSRGREAPALLGLGGP